MVKRSYDQYCGLAAALDLLGERWTVLIIRDLLMGPKRFTDLQDRLSGIGTGLLSQRLRELEDAGIIEKTTLPPPAASTVYQLTPDGDALRPALLHLARWGMRRLGDPKPGQRLDAETLALGLSTRFNRKAAADVEGVYTLMLDGQPLEVRITNGQIKIQPGNPEKSRAVVSTDTMTLLSLNSGRTLLADAMASKSITAEGDRDTLRMLARAFAL